MSSTSRRALLLMLLATLSFVLMQVVVKRARESGMDPLAVMFFRTAPGLPFLTLALMRRGQSLKPDMPLNLFVRSLFGSLAMVTNFTAVRSLSLGQFAALQLTQPVFVALIAPTLIKERVVFATWLAMAFAAGGALVLLAPDTRAASAPMLPILLAITSALASAFAMIWVRKSTETDPAERVVLYFAAWVSSVSLLLGCLSGSFDHAFDLTALPRLLLLSAGMAGFGTLGQVLMTHAYLRGKASSVSIVGYSSVPFSMLLDLVLWDVAPASSVYLGACLMIVAAVLILRKG